MLTLIKSIYDIQETFHLPIVSPYFFFLPPFHIITFFNTHSLVSPYTTAHGFPFNTLHIYKRQNSFIFFKTPSLFLNFLLLFLTHFSPARKSSNIVFMSVCVIFLLLSQISMNYFWSFNLFPMTAHSCCLFISILLLISMNHIPQ